VTLGADARGSRAHDHDPRRRLPGDRALNRSIAHSASHVGQIVCLARHFAGDTWTSLTIPKGTSANIKGEFKK
jgi:hypothetical protein